MSSLRGIFLEYFSLYSKADADQMCSLKNTVLKTAFQVLFQEFLQNFSGKLFYGIPGDCYLLKLQIKTVKERCSNLPFMFLRYFRYFPGNYSEVLILWEGEGGIIPLCKSSICFSKINKSFTNHFYFVLKVGGTSSIKIQT